MRQKAVSLFLCYLILFACGAVEAGKRRRSESSENSGSGWWSTLTYMAVGGGLMAVGLPALGFTSAGIAANSMAASLMSWSAVANGGGVPAGGLVATLQSLDDKRPKSQTKRTDLFSKGADGKTQTRPHPSSGR
nr:interferon alpha-inducible protein 6 isoform X1 [Equus asinus]XP_044626090.1 interferon alpha-inducible protein 6 isoform X1 [Equus asinus]